MNSTNPINQQSAGTLPAEAAVLLKIKQEMHKVLVGQELLVDRLLIALICNQHILIEGVPGLAKSLSVTTLAGTLGLNFNRIQFTPDLLPADIIGTLVYNPKTGEFYPRKGPVFSNIILADEINRAPAKVQSALLESMQERQVTIGDETWPLDEPFLVMATQNPIEQEGTYPLPEAQTDRFMLKVKINYPARSEELAILRLMARTSPIPKISRIAGIQEIMKLRSFINEIYMDPKLEEYIVDLIIATREPSSCGLDMAHLIRYGASPRASIYLTLASKGMALLEGRNYVIPEDIRSIAPDVLRHRVMGTYEAEAEGVDSDELLMRILKALPSP